MICEYKKLQSSHFIILVFVWNKSTLKSSIINQYSFFWHEFFTLSFNWFTSIRGIIRSQTPNFYSYFYLSRRLQAKQTRFCKLWYYLLARMDTADIYLCIFFFQFIIKYNVRLKSNKYTMSVNVTLTLRDTVPKDRVSINNNCELDIWQWCDLISGSYTTYSTCTWGLSHGDIGCG